jgi:hypothetical protein
MLMLIKLRWIEIGCFRFKLYSNLEWYLFYPNPTRMGFESFRFNNKNSIIIMQLAIIYMSVKSWTMKTSLCSTWNFAILNFELFSG